MMHPVLNSPPLPGVPRNRRVMVAVSGGIDSTALLHALVGSGFRKLVVVHLDHGLRGRAGAGDAVFVKKLARRYALPFIGGKADVAGLARARKISIETAAREARYRFFAKCARETRCRTLVLAHHADDQVETFLFNLMRGGGTGMGGMRPRAVRAIDGVKLEILRPWLGVWRMEIAEYAAREKLRYREDATNASPDHTRNRIRSRILPMLAQEFGRAVTKALWRAADVLAAQQEWIDEVLPPAGDELPVSGLRALPEALQRIAIHEWLRRHHTPQISYRLVETVREMVPADATKAKVNLPAGRYARRRAGVLFVEGGRR